MKGASRIGSAVLADGNGTLLAESFSARWAG